MNTPIPTLFWLVVVTLIMEGCAGHGTRTDWPAIEGHVLNIQDRTPIVDAVVIAEWRGYDGYSQSQCFHSNAAITDANGHFVIPSWKNTGRSATAIQYQQVSIDAIYKPGFRESSKTYGEVRPRRKIYLLERDASTASERLKYLVAKISVCTANETAREHMKPLLRAIGREALGLYRHEDKQAMIWIAGKMASVLDGSYREMQFKEALEYIRNNI